MSLNIFRKNPLKEFSNDLKVTLKNRNVEIIKSLNSLYQKENDLLEEQRVIDLKLESAKKELNDLVLLKNAAVKEFTENISNGRNASTTKTTFEQKRVNEKQSEINSLLVKAKKNSENLRVVSNEIEIFTKKLYKNSVLENNALRDMDKNVQFMHEKLVEHEKELDEEKKKFDDSLKPVLN